MKFSSAEPKCWVLCFAHSNGGHGGDEFTVSLDDFSDLFQP